MQVKARTMILQKRYYQILAMLLVGLIIVSCSEDRMSKKELEQMCSSGIVRVTHYYYYTLSVDDVPIAYATPDYVFFEESELVPASVDCVGAFISSEGEIITSMQLLMLDKFNWRDYSQTLIDEYQQLYEETRTRGKEIGYSILRDLSVVFTHKDEMEEISSVMAGAERIIAAVQNGDIDVKLESTFYVDNLAGKQNQLYFQKKDAALGLALFQLTTSATPYSAHVFPMATSEELKENLIQHLIAPQQFFMFGYDNQGNITMQRTGLSAKDVSEKFYDTSSLEKKFKIKYGNPIISDSGKFAGILLEQCGFVNSASIEEFVGK